MKESTACRLFFYVTIQRTTLKRTKRREFVMTEKEARNLSEKASKACMPESQLIRLLIAGYHPPEAPGKEFYDDMRELLKASGELVAAPKEADPNTASFLLSEALALKELRLKLERKYLSGERSDIQWR